MASNTLKRQSGMATVAGTTIYTVPANTTLTIVGLRAANSDNTADHTVHATINDVLITGSETPLPTGSAIEFIDGKIVAQAGDVIVVYGDTDNDVHVWVSYLEQTV